MKAGSPVWMPDANPELVAVRPFVGGERALDLGGRRDGVVRRGERDEERVALRVDLEAAMPVDRVPQEVAVRREQAGVDVAETPEQPGRALDVGEQEGDRAGRGRSGHVQQVWLRGEAVVRGARASARGRRDDVSSRRPRRSSDHLQPGSLKLAIRVCHGLVSAGVPDTG